MYEGRGTGWIPDLPDERDRTLTQILVRTEPGLAPPTKPLPPSVNLRGSFPEPVYDQGTTNSCTANAAAGLIEYFRTVSGRPVLSPSRLFIYKTTRNLLGQTLDIGAFPRTTLQALVLFGAPPEPFWPFTPGNVQAEPPAFAYGFGGNYKATEYYRYEEEGLSKEELLLRIRTQLAARLPSMFGFYLFPSLQQANASGAIPMPAPGEQPTGGHAVVAAGYDDQREIWNQAGGPVTKGALLIRNSWGPGWGDRGWGWLPYDYVLGDLAVDWWSLLNQEWAPIPELVRELRAEGEGE